MQAFLQHVGHRNHQHLTDTVTTVRVTDELLKGILSSPERTFFSESREMRAAFPNGEFNCWGLMGRAEARFNEMEVGDLVLMAPTIGVHGGGVRQLGVVKVKCPIRCYEVSRLLWPNIDDPRKLYPHLFFFETEVGFRSWYTFLGDVGYDAMYNPRGYFLRLNTTCFQRWGGVQGYLSYLRRECGFTALTRPAN